MLVVAPDGRVRNGHHVSGGGWPHHYGLGGVVHSVPGIRYSLHDGSWTEREDPHPLDTKDSSVGMTGHPYNIMGTRKKVEVEEPPTLCDCPPETDEIPWIGTRVTGKAFPLEHVCRYEVVVDGMA